jgi:hypothetical protein
MSRSIDIKSITELIIFIEKDCEKQPSTLIQKYREGKVDEKEFIKELSLSTSDLQNMINKLSKETITMFYTYSKQNVKDMLTNLQIVKNI